MSGRRDSFVFSAISAPSALRCSGPRKIGIKCLTCLIDTFRLVER